MQEIKLRLRMITLGLKDFMKFDQQGLLDIVCKDSRDLAILELLRSKGAAGLSPKEIHELVRRDTGLKYHHISRRIRSMNKRMRKEIGENVAEKVGRNWTLNVFMIRNWNVDTNDLEKTSNRKPKS